MRAELTREEYIAQYPIQQIFIGDAQKLEAAKWKIKPEFILKHFQADREWFEAHDLFIRFEVGFTSDLGSLLDSLAKRWQGIGIPLQGNGMLFSFLYFCSVVTKKKDRNERK